MRLEIFYVSGRSVALLLKKSPSFRAGKTLTLHTLCCGCGCSERFVHTLIRCNLQIVGIAKTIGSITKKPVPSGLESGLLDRSFESLVGYTCIAHGLGDYSIKHLVLSGQATKRVMKISMPAPIEANGMVIDRNIRFDIGFLRCRWVEDQNFLTIRTNVSERFSFGNDAVCN